MPEYGQNITKGVKYLKINKIDANGDDFGQRLQQANNIRINYSDVGNTLYSILTTQDQGDSYLMGVIPQENTSSEGRFGFSLEASRSYNTNSPTLNPVWSADVAPFYNSFFFGMGNAGTATGDATDFYSSGNSTYRSASYEFRRSPNENLNLFFSCSIINNTVSDSELTVRVIINNSLGQSVTESVLFVLTCVGSSTSTQEITYSLPEVMTSQGNVLTIFGESDAVAPLSASYAEFKIIADSIDTPTEPPISISPENIEFVNSDYNAVFGNATTPRYSSIFQDVDYSTGNITPTNINVLTNGTAVKAPVQDSNYSQTAWTRGRYVGSRGSSLDFNK